MKVKSELIFFMNNAVLFLIMVSDMRSYMLDVIEVFVCPCFRVRAYERGLGAGRILC